MGLHQPPGVHGCVQVRLRNREPSPLSPSHHIAMDEIDKALDLVVGGLTDENYEQSLAFYRFWFGVGQMYHRISPDQIFDVTWVKRRMGSMESDLVSGKLIHSRVRLILRFASDAELDHHLAPYSIGLQSRLCARTLQEFLSNNLRVVRDGKVRSLYASFCADANLIAHWANLGYLEEVAIHNQILQSLISHPALHDHQAYALIILFKLAGATFEAYADPPVVDRCFELLKNHCLLDLQNQQGPTWKILERTKQVRSPSALKGGHCSKANSQEVIELRERGWEGLPPPPVFTTGKPKPTGTNQKDPAATPVATSIGLPNRDLEPQAPRPPPPEPPAIPRVDTVHASPVISATHSPSISTSSLSDFTTEGASDDGSPTGTFADVSDDEILVDPMAVVPHETFYLEDGNVEVLCGNTLFRVTASILSFHSPALRQMFTQTNLATAESPNGCPRILSSDTAADFTTLLKMIYLPGFVTPPLCCQALLLTPIYPQIP